MLSNYKKEILSLNTKGSTMPILGEDSKYHILYMTTNLVNNKIYIGVHSSVNLKDRYIGCGIYYRSCVSEQMCGQSKFARSVVKYGLNNFKRENLLYFSTGSEAYEFESIVVTSEFVNRDYVLNSTTGGSNPPVRRGEKNGNYGNFWTEEKKRQASEYAKLTKRSVGSKNPRAIKTRVLNLETKELLEIGSVSEVEKLLGLKPSSLTFMYAERGPSIFKKKYFIIYEKDYLELGKKNLIKSKIEESISRSRFKSSINQIFNINDCKEY